MTCLWNKSLLLISPYSMPKYTIFMPLCYDIIKNQYQISDFINENVTQPAWSQIVHFIKFQWSAPHWMRDFYQIFCSINLWLLKGNIMRATLDQKDQSSSNEEQFCCSILLSSTWMRFLSYICRVEELP